MCVKCSWLQENQKRNDKEKGINFHHLILAVLLKWKLHKSLVSWLHLPSIQEKCKNKKNVINNVPSCCIFLCSQTPKGNRRSIIWLQSWWEHWKYHQTFSISIIMVMQIPCWSLKLPCCSGASQKHLVTSACLEGDAWMKTQLKSYWKWPKHLFLPELFLSLIFLCGWWPYLCFS